MGTWGTSLYSGDLAADLRSTIGAVARLPFDGDQLLDLLCETEPASGDPDDEEHLTFWLIVADQFCKRGIPCERVRARAMQIIDEGQDLALMKELGMGAADLRRRQAVLAELRERLTNSRVSAPRKTLKKPQELVMQAGDLYCYPTSKGVCINPYFKTKELIPEWSQDGWGAVLIAETGRAFGYLSWYRPVEARGNWPHRPTLPELLEGPGWSLRHPGTCSALHLRRMELQPLGKFAVNVELLERSVHPRMPTPAMVTSADISIANELRPYGYGQQEQPLAEWLLATPPAE